MVTGHSFQRGVGYGKVGEIASIDRGWLLNPGQVFLTFEDQVGEIASIDRGWLLNSSPFDEVMSSGRRNSLD